MSRTATMAAGFFMILMGIQLHLVESFTMTPRVSHFLNDNFSQPQPQPFVPAAGDFSVPQQNRNSPYYQTSYSQPRGNQVGGIQQTVPLRNAGQSTIVPPRWICWPVLFLGAFLLLQGATKPRD